MQRISVHELEKLLADGVVDGMLIDVREPFEFKEKRIRGAENIPLGSLDTSIDSLKDMANVYVYCLSGARSLYACQELSRIGINVINIDGGMLAWERAGYAVERN